MNFLLKSPFVISLSILSFFLFTIPTQLSAQKKKDSNYNQPTYNEKLYSGLQWRNIGPFRGGRSAAVCGIPGKSMLFYMGSTAGGESAHIASKYLLQRMMESIIKKISPLTPMISSTVIS
jgi:hypothetical protein